MPGTVLGTGELSWRLRQRPCLTVHLQKQILVRVPVCKVAYTVLSIRALGRKEVGTVIYESCAGFCFCFCSYCVLGLVPDAIDLII